MKISICGFGNVGGALYSYIAPGCPHEVSIYDPQKGRHDDISKTEVNFISVTAPTKGFKVDLTNIEHCLKRTSPDSINFIRSTVTPGTCDALMKKHNKLVISMPEFLTQRQARSDFKKIPILFGGRGTNHKSRISYAMGLVFPKKRMKQMTNKECELAKLAHNNLAALKVMYANSIWDICQIHKCSYEDVKAGMLLSGLFSKNHLQVPGPDGYMGFGGVCLPKDQESFIGWIDQCAGKHGLMKVLMDCYTLNRAQRGIKEVPTTVGHHSV